MTKMELIKRVGNLEKQLAEARRRTPASSTPAAAALYESEERIRAILNTAVEGILTIDERGLIDSINPAGEKMFGYGAEELIGQNVKVLMPSPFREEHDAYIRRYLQMGQARIIGIGREVVGRRKDGSLFPMDLSVGEVRLAGRRLFTGILRDITGRKEAEARLAEMAENLSQKNKELETIFYVASHDLRSPLVNIQGFSKELERACERLQALLEAGTNGSSAKPEARRLLQEEIPEAISYIKTGVVKMEKLLAGFLRFSRLGRAALRIEPINMSMLMKNVVRSMEFQVKNSGATVNVSALPPAWGDETQLTQVFSNLLDNALKYLQPGRPGQVTVSGWEKEGESVFAVRDNGIGIAAEHQKKIFEIFHRLEPNQTPGEGLGLTIAQRLVERQNGRIWIESAPGEGSAFYVALPARNPNPEPTR